MRSNPLSVSFFIYRNIKKRRKASSRVGVDPGPSLDANQPFPTNPTLPFSAAGGHQAASPLDLVFAKYPPYYTEARRDIDIKFWNPEPEPAAAKSLYRAAPAMPAPVARFYEGTAPPLTITPPPSARQSMAGSPLTSAPAARPPKQPLPYSSKKPSSKHK
jgi:hypothetical protein